LLIVLNKKIREPQGQFFFFVIYKNIKHNFDGPDVKNISRKLYDKIIFMMWMTIFWKLSLCIVVYNVIHYNIKPMNTKLVLLNKNISHIAHGSEKK